MRTTLLGSQDVTMSTIWWPRVLFVVLFPTIAPLTALLFLLARYGYYPLIERQYLELFRKTLVGVWRGGKRS